jgi:lysozyme
MKTSKAGVDFIKGYEKLKLQPYKCSGGWWTIGYGHAISKTDKPDWSVTPTEAIELLERDLSKAEGAVGRYIRVRLVQCQFDALVSFTFNAGTGALQSSTLRQKLNRGEYDDAANEFGRWIIAGGQRSLGLIRRREAERRLYVAHS